MATPKNNSTTNSALWVIALSLAVIAACLVVLVTRQQHSANTDTAVATEPPAARPEPPRRLPQAFNVSPPRPEPPAPPQLIEVSANTTEAAPPPEPEPVAPAAVPQPIVSSGLAPLTPLAVTNASNSPALISGRVTLDGTPPPETLISLDPQCGQLHKSVTNWTKFYDVSKDGGLADVFVFISGGFKGQKFPTPSTPVVLNQKGCFFQPYVFGIMTGQKLLVKNSDRFFHNVHAEPRPDGKNPGFNLAESAGTIITKSFQYPEIAVKLHCDLHPWMYAYACVVDNPFYAVTDAKGNFVISNVPPGNYVLEAYHRKTHGLRIGETQDITVIDGKTTTVSFTIRSPMPDGGIAGRR